MKTRLSSTSCGRFATSRTPNNFNIVRILCPKSLQSPARDLLVPAFNQQLLSQYFNPLLLSIPHIVNEVSMDCLPSRSHLADKTSFSQPGFFQRLCVHEDSLTNLAREREKGDGLLYRRRTCGFGGIRCLPFFDCPDGVRWD